MNEKILEFILNIFALITRKSDKQFIKLAEIYVEQFFSRIYGNKIAKTQKESFTKLLEFYKSTNAVYNYSLACRIVNNELPKSQRLQILNYFLEYLFFIQKNDILHSGESETYDFIFDVAKALKISEETFLNCKRFVADEFYDISDKHNLVYAKKQNPEISGVNYLKLDDISGYFVFYNFHESSIVLFKYFGSENTTLNSQVIFPRKTYAIKTGSVIAKNGIPIIYYSDIINKIKGISKSHIIELSVENVDFKYPKSNFGISNLNFFAKTGELIGVLGGSGVGKSTLFNVLNGNYNPQKGTITFNGQDLQANKLIIQHYMGFVPQDDTLFERLTVFENLYYTAKLSFSNALDEDVRNLVNTKLSEFGLWDIRHFQVGTPAQRRISGGQRKRLNILLEIIRNPKILLVDEPTSGLSSSDSMKAIMLLKEQVLQGCLTIVNIHQPSSDIFRLFDKILILDEGGVMIYYGNPIEAIKHFKKNVHRIDSDIAECIVCKNIRTDEIFDIVEERKVDEFGSITEERKVSSQEWSSRFLGTSKLCKNDSLPNLESKRIGFFKQFRLYLERFAISKLRDREFFTFSLLTPTILSLIISFYSKYYTTNEIGNFEYLFYHNTNIPIFFLTSIIANIFIGMILTCDIVIKDLNINKREYFLFLNKTAYFNSKITYFLILSLIQSFIYTIISVNILQFNGIILELWIVLFMMSSIGNITGLLVSTIFKSISAVYLFVPFLIIPQIIFCGITIPFDKLNFKVSSTEYVPVVGVISPSMWGTEALIVKQFKDNDYQKYFFKVDRIESQSRIASQHLIPKLFKIIEQINMQNQDKELLKILVNQLNSGLKQLYAPSELIVDTNQDSIYQTIQIDKIVSFLILKQKYCEQILSKSRSEHDSILNAIIKNYGSLDKLLLLKYKNLNKGVENMTLMRNDLFPIKAVGEHLVQRIDPIYKDPISRYGKAHFLSATKTIGNLTLDTYVFNVFILIIFFVLLYIILISNIIQKIVLYIKNNIFYIKNRLIKILPKFLFLKITNFLLYCI